MQAYQDEFEDYTASGRTLPSPSKPKRSGYSPRFDRRRGKAGKLTNGIQRRCDKRRG